MERLALAVRRLLAEMGSHKAVSGPGAAPMPTLDGKRLYLLDDSLGVMEKFVPLPVHATNGSASFLLHTGETIDELVAAICQSRPQIVLLDRYLRGTLKGEDLVAPLRALLPSALIIGFSSEAAAFRHFERQGADGFVEKDTDDPQASLGRLELLIGALLG